MLAEEFGYQVTSRPAAELTETVRPETEQALQAAKAALANVSMGVTGPAFFFIVWFIIAGLRDSPTPFFIGVLGVILAIFWNVVVASPERTAIVELEEKIPAVLASPWQAWPCRVEAIAGDQAKRLLLLDPDGGVAREFRSAIPDTVWIGMTDGRALIWFAGDMRFGGLASLPGGSPIWWVSTPKATSQPTPSGPRQRLIEEELTRQAVTYAFGEWL
ncbi:hypothetical protein OG195_27325 [Streptomyces sp. NBC_01362]|uniref:hypothetical protein n=1 Tax=Streptomyces sp. NBC_01362 TaxID=2903839 RepID=UPI002E35DFC8|nr:hypothetical protein [Streptomyces sp. NBC_01362]